MATNATELLPGQSPPLTIITSTNQSGIVLIATALGLSFSFVSILLRVFIRLDFCNQFARDDVAAVASMVFAVLQSTTVFVAVSKGFGKTLSDISPDHLLPMQKALYSSDLLYIATIWLSKCSVAFLFLRLSPDKNHSRASTITLFGSTVLMVASIFASALRCELSHPWDFIGVKCINLLARWQAVAAFDIITELALFATSIYLVANLRLSLEKKSLVIFAFSLRLPIIVAIALRLYYLNFEFHSSDPTLDGTLASACTQIQLNYAIVAATTPCLRPFMTALSTNYGAPAENKTSPNTTKNNEYSLSKLSKLGSSRGGKPQPAPTLRWDSTQHNALVLTSDHHSIGSHESKQMIINKNTEWAVEYEGSSKNL